MDWRHAYQEHQLMIRDQLQRAKDAGVVVMRLACGEAEAEAKRRKRAA
jgi:hypothetical protein